MDRMSMREVSCDSRCKIESRKRFRLEVCGSHDKLPEKPSKFEMILLCSGSSTIGMIMEMEF